MSHENQQMTSATHVRVYRVALSTSFKTLISLIRNVRDADPPDDRSRIIQVVLKGDADWQFRDVTNPNSYFSVAADTEKLIPALNVADTIAVASVSGTPNLEIEAYFG